jgi:hypothetical protein
MQIYLPDLHEHQHRVKAERKRFNVYDCGRRWGKNTLGHELISDVVIDMHMPFGWFAPTNKYLAETWRAVQSIFQPAITDKSEQEHRLEFIGGGVFECWSLEIDGAGRSRKYRRVAIDEAAIVAKLMDKWNNDILATLADYDGDADIFSTPKGFNAFHQLWSKGQDKDSKEWKSWDPMPTSQNPFIGKSFIEMSQQNMPASAFNQEFLAQFLDDAGLVFRRVMGAITAQWQTSPPEVKDEEEKRRYVFGVDWGKSNDWTVVMVLDLLTHEVVNYDRFNQIDYRVQRQRLEALYKVFKPDIIIAERNAMGDPIIEELQRSGMPVQPFTTTQASKIKAIEDLSLAFEQGDIKIPNDQILISELQSYAGERLPSGLMRYNAPDGMHDDCVMALALAWQGCAKETIMVANPFYD